MTKAIDDANWSIRVANRDHNKCVWPKCNNRYYMSSHHIIGRGLHALRLIIENGIYVCGKHHDYLEKIKGTALYDKVIILLIGRKRYTELKDLESEALLDLTSVRIVTGDESSQIGF